MRRNIEDLLNLLPRPTFEMGTAHVKAKVKSYAEIGFTVGISTGFTSVLRGKSVSESVTRRTCDIA